MSIIIAFDSRNYAIKSMCANRWCRFQAKTIFAFISENVICLFGMTNGSFEPQRESGMFIGKVTTKAEIATIKHFACLWLFGNAVFVTHSVVCLPLEFLWRLTQNSAATQSYRSSEFSQNDQTYQKPNMQIHNHVFSDLFHWFALFFKNLFSLHSLRKSMFENLFNVLKFDTPNCPFPNSPENKAKTRNGKDTNRQHS